MSSIGAILAEMMMQKLVSWIDPSSMPIQHISKSQMCAPKCGKNLIQNIDVLTGFQYFKMLIKETDLTTCVIMELSCSNCFAIKFRLTIWNDFSNKMQATVNLVVFFF